MSSSLNGGSDLYEWQQGITAGLTGQLTRIEVFVDQYAGTTEFSVHLGALWHDGQAAWSTAAALDRGWNTLDVTAANIFLVGGDRFAIGIHGQGLNIFPPDLGFSYGNLYAGGELYLNGSTAESVGNDLNFRTYVDPDRSLIPESGSLLLLGAGIAAAAVTRRKALRCPSLRDLPAGSRLVA